MQPGDRVWYRQAQRSGRIATRNVPAVFVSGPTPKKRVRVRIPFMHDLFTDVTVLETNVRARDENRPTDEMLLASMSVNS